MKNLFNMVIGLISLLISVLISVFFGINHGINGYFFGAALGFTGCILIANIIRVMSLKFQGRKR